MQDHARKASVVSKAIPSFAMLQAARATGQSMSQGSDISEPSGHAMAAAQPLDQIANEQPTWGLLKCSNHPL